MAGTLQRVVVVGGGVIGLSCAWKLADAGAEVVVVDPAPGRGGASWVAGGMLAPVTEAWPGEERLLELGSASLALWPSFDVALTAAAGMPAGLRAEGTLALAVDAADRAELDSLAKHLASLGREVRWLSRPEVRALEPGLGPAVRGGLDVPGDLAVDNRALLDALLAALGGAGRADSAGDRAAVGRGGAPRGECAAVGGSGAPRGEWAAVGGSGACRGGCAAVGGSGACRGGCAAVGGSGECAAGVTFVPARAVGVRAGAVELAGGDVVRGDLVVLAAGAWSAGLHPGLRGRLRPVKGEIVRLRSRGTALPPPGRTVRAAVQGRPVYLVPRDGGGLVLGATQYEAGFDTSVIAAGVRDLLHDAEVVLPGIAEYAIEETSAGLRPASTDNLPLLGWLEPGVLAATGHGRNGILLAPITAAAVVALAGGGRVPPEIDLLEADDETAAQRR